MGLKVRNLGKIAEGRKNHAQGGLPEERQAFHAGPERSFTGGSVGRELPGGSGCRVRGCDCPWAGRPGREREGLGGKRFGRGRS